MANPEMPPPVPRRTNGDEPCPAQEDRVALETVRCQGRAGHPERYHYWRGRNGAQRWWWWNDEGGGWAHHELAP